MSEQSLPFKSPSLTTAVQGPRVKNPWLRSEVPNLGHMYPRGTFAYLKGYI